MNHISISSFKSGDKVQGVYLASEVSIDTTSQGNPYMKITLQDTTGKFPANAWFVDPAIKSGDVVETEVTVQTYNGKLNGKINAVKVVSNPTEEEMKDIIPSSPYNIEDMTTKLVGLIESIGDKELHLLVSTLFDKVRSTFCVWPAAKGVHHDTIGGLLQHTLEMALTADSLSKIYKIVNRDLLLAGTILHDYAKLWEFHTTACGLVDQYSIEGSLLGHLHMGACIIEDEGASLGIDPHRILLLKHMLLSHHGNREWGAVQLPSFPEASMLFLIDMISSRMEIYRKEYGKLEPGQMANESCRVLDGVRVYRHELAPESIDWTFPEN